MLPGYVDKVRRQRLDHLPRARARACARPRPSPAQYMRGELKVDEFITFTFPLDGINEAFDRMHSGEAIRSVIHYK